MHLKEIHFPYVNPNFHHLGWRSCFFRNSTSVLISSLSIVLLQAGGGILPGMPSVRKPQYDKWRQTPPGSHTVRGKGQAHPKFRTARADEQRGGVPAGDAFYAEKTTPETKPRQSAETGHLE
jgi:hypothetical protein